MQFEMLSIQEKLNKTIVFITHDINEAFKLGNKVAIMRDGKIIQTDTPEDMTNSPTDDYVREFIDSADKSQIYYVKSYMQMPECLIHIREGVQIALKKMRTHGVSSAYIIGNGMRYVGVLPLEAAFKVRSGEITFEEAIIKDMITTTEDTQIADLMPIAANARYPIAVLDENQRLKGIISKAAVLTSLI